MIRLVVFFICSQFAFGTELSEYNFQEILETEVVRNPGKPANGTRTWIIKEDKDFNPRPDDHPGFFYISSIDVDSSGIVLVLDGFARRVYKFDSQGSLIQTITLKASKKGEFDNLLKSLHGKEGRFYILERNAIHVFNPFGKVEKTIVFKESLFDFGLMKGGQIIAGVNIGHGGREIALFSPLGEKLRILFKSPPIKEMPKLETTAQGIMSHIYLPSLLMNVVDDKTIIWGHSSQYRLHVTGHNGEILRIVERDAPPEHLSEPDIKALVESVQENMKRKGIRMTEEEILRIVPIGQNIPHFHFILSDDNGFIYAIRLDRQNQTIDVFDNKGIYLERVQSPIFPIYKIADGFAYGLKRLGRPEGGVETVAISRYPFQPRINAGNSAQDPARKKHREELSIS